MSHAQVEPVLPVSFAGPPKSAAPLGQESSIPEATVAHFASIEALDFTLSTDFGYSEEDLASMTVNDKAYALRYLLDNGGGPLTPLP